MAPVPLRPLSRLQHLHRVSRYLPDHLWRHQSLPPAWTPSSSHYCLTSRPNSHGSNTSGSQPRPSHQPRRQSHLTFPVYTLGKESFSTFCTRVNAVIDSHFPSLRGQTATTTANVDASCSLRAHLLVSLPANLVKTFQEKPQYVDRGIKMWTLICELQEHRSPQDLLLNLRLLFSLRQGSTQTDADFLS